MVVPKSFIMNFLHLFCLFVLTTAESEIRANLNNRNVNQRSSLASDESDEFDESNESNETNESNESNESDYIESSPFCLSKSCLKNGEEIIKNMNPSVNPCEDFYEFACGKWAVNHPLPRNLAIFDLRKEMHLNIIKILQEILEETGPADESLEKARTWYKSCMDDADTLESKGLESLASILSQIGGWPLTMNAEDWNETEFNWQKVDEFFSRLSGKNTFFSIAVTPDVENYDHKLTINYPDLPLFSTIDYDRQKMYADKKYKNLIIEVALAISEKIGSNVSRRQIHDEVEEFLEIEKLLNGAKTRGLKWGRKQTIGELVNFLKPIKSKKSTSKIDILETINNLLESAMIKVNETETVKVQVMGYFPTLLYILDQFSPRKIVNFVHWSFISSMLDYTSERFAKMKFDVGKSFYGIKEMEPRSQICVENVKMSHILANEFIERYFTPDVKSEAIKLVESIQNQLEKVVQESTWLDAMAKNESVERVKDITKLIGYPSWYDNKTALLDAYNQLSIGSNYFENQLNYATFNYKKSLSKLDQEFYFERWISTDDDYAFFMVNAFYIMFTNTIAIPAANFQPPFFSSSQPDYLNYGFAGFFIAHEMAHIFDDQGRTIQSDGYWSDWIPETHKKYRNKIACFIRQTTELTKNEKKSKFQERHGVGILTKNENIADTTGLQILYKSYKEKTKNSQQLKLLELDHFTDDQLFFLSFANFFCENLTTEVEAFRAEDDNHSKPKYRVIGSVSNSKEFAKAFRCPAGSPMNPDDKCLIFE